MGVTKPYDISKDNWDGSLAGLDFFNLLSLDPYKVYSLKEVKSQISKVTMLLHTDRLRSTGLVPPANVNQVNVNLAVAFLSNGYGRTRLDKTRWQQVASEGRRGWQIHAEIIRKEKQAAEEKKHREAAAAAAAAAARREAKAAAFEKDRLMRAFAQHNGEGGRNRSYPSCSNSSAWTGQRQENRWWALSEPEARYFWDVPRTRPTRNPGNNDDGFMPSAGTWTNFRSGRTHPSAKFSSYDEDSSDGEIDFGGGYKPDGEDSSVRVDSLGGEDSYGGHDFFYEADSFDSGVIHDDQDRSGGEDSYGGHDFFYEAASADGGVIHDDQDRSGGENNYGGEDFFCEADSADGEDNYDDQDSYDGEDFSYGEDGFGDDPYSPDIPNNARQASRQTDR